MKPAKDQRNLDFDGSQKRQDEIERHEQQSKELITKINKAKKELKELNQVMKDVMESDEKFAEFEVERKDIMNRRKIRKAEIEAQHPTNMEKIEELKSEKKDLETQLNELLVVTVQNNENLDIEDETGTPMQREIKVKLKRRK